MGHHPTGMYKALTSAVAACAAVVSLTACQALEPEPARPAVTVSPSAVADSFGKYSPVSEELVAALGAKIPSVGWELFGETAIQRQPDGTCTLFLPTFKSDSDLVKASDGFTTVMEAANPVLERHGFAPIKALDKASEGYWSVTSANAQGATVNLAGRTDVMLRVDVPVESERCTAEDVAGLG